MFVKLSQEQLKNKIEFIDQYVKASNAADGSSFDANANVTSKNIATLEAELHKDFNIQVNRSLLCNKITELYDEKLAEEYVRQLQDHEIYTHDESSIKPYCVSVSLYPFLTNGLKDLGGESGAPKHLDSFCGSFVNLVFAISSQFAGAVATVEFLMYFDYYARKDYGDNYLETNVVDIQNHLQHVVYAINQPAAARGYQSVFWNITVYDEHYFEGMFGGFMFPDFTPAKYDGIEKLQAFFLDWFNKERTKAVLTFPVVTAAMLVENDQPKDKRFADVCATNMSEGGSFFVYMSESADSLASCCRLRNEFSDNTFSYSLGAGGVATGSVNVMTLNMNRFVQNVAKTANPDTLMETILSRLEDQIDKMQKYQLSYRTIVKEYLDAKMLTVYDANFISLNKQFVTIGINGMVEAAEFLGYEISDNDEYKQFVSSMLKVIYDKNKQFKKETGFLINTEFVPAENLGVKNAKWDKKDGYVVPRDCYNSYFYIVENESTNPIEKFKLHGREMIQYLDGGSALHLNLDEKLNKEGFLKLFNVAAKSGCNYWCVNVKITICNECENIDKRTLYKCPKCGSENVDHGTRVIGYLKRVSAFSSARQKEESLRYYAREKKWA